MTDSLTVHTARFAVLQDLGRFGYSRLGVSVNGALDQYATRVANALVGNDVNSPLIEIMASDFAFSLSTGGAVSITGAPADIAVGDGARVQWQPFAVRRDEIVTVTRIREGLRVYVAVGGRLHASYILGSCAPDTVIGIGRSLKGGDKVALTPPRLKFQGTSERLRVRIPRYGSPWTIRACDGPEAGAFGECIELFYSTEYRVGIQSNHIGLRLEGFHLKSSLSGELLSRGVPVGAVEVPPSSELLVLQRGRGVTAGYPVIAVATSVSLAGLGQARPGHCIRFSRSTVPEAVRAYRRQQVHVRALTRAAATLWR